MQLKTNLKKLDFLKLDSDNVERCIYGQMTAHCCSQAASDLINKCCKNVYTNMHANLKYSILNGAPRERIDKLSIPFLSPI